MSQTAIPLEFERYLQNQISVGDAPDMNEMIFAHIPGLDPSQPINRENGLPDVSLWVHQQDIDQVGKLGDNALAYSVVIPGTVAEFTFNAIYLRDKSVPNSCGMVVHKAEETKENGMASTKSLVQAYDGAAQIAGITVDASTWQIDYQARLKGIEEDHRLACLDSYGHTAFVDGFDVTQQADPNKYKVTPGVVYVGGLRGVLTGEVLQTITTKPNGLYVDVVRQGTALSVWENKVTITVSETELTDYVDGNGDQHYVAELAGINADGSVVDWRVKGGLALAELKSNAASNSDIDSGSTASKHIKLPQFWRGIAKQLTARFSELNLKTNVMSFVSKAGLYTGWNNGDPVDSGGLTSVVGNQLQIMSAEGHATQLLFGDGYAKFRPQWGSGRWVDFFTTYNRPKMSDISGMTMVAMVNFDGATPNVPARGSFNVNRIIDNGIGDYTIEFENPVSIEKRVIICGQFAILNQADAYTFGEHVKADTTPTLISETQIRLLSRRERNVDVSRAYVIVFGELA
ncbi:phage tail protein [Vibrio sp. RE88]|uniref:phage tail-collar fiber domain-containing protein n=1 Tax=Vibrio sp. RE88 TaxID=2607610 RepID=UPI0020A53E4A|nr:phage tail protein [Vibrio sp. RE88]